MPDSFASFAAEYAVYGYPVLFLGVLLESAGVPLPGETAVLTAGFLASPEGGGHFNIIWVIALTAVAAILGDNLGYEIGRHFARPRLAQGRGFFFLTPAVLKNAESYFERYGTWTIFFGRFVAALRVAAALAAGTAGMPWPRFFVANAAGAVVWASTIALLGYFGGSSISHLHQWLGKGSVVILGCVALLIGLPFLLRRARKMPLERYLPNQLGRTLLVVSLELILIALLVLLAQGQRTSHWDRAVADWLGDHRGPVVDGLALAGGYLSTLPAVVGAVGLFLMFWYRSGRPQREMAAVGIALAASEALGWLLIALLHGRDIAVVRAEMWPFGFAGVVALRALAVYGTMAYLLALRWPRRARLIHALAGMVILWAGLGIVVRGRQTFTEIVVEYAAGAVVLFAVVWWLEGHGRMAETLPVER